MSETGGTGWADGQVVRDGTCVRYRDYGGSGVPVVLLHGLAGYAGEWDVTARWLSGRHRVVAVDQRGHGASDRRPADVSRAAYVADVLAVLDRLALRRVVLVGQSWGGHTAMLAAAAHPDRVEALVMIEAGIGGADPEGPARIGAWLDSWPVPFGTREAAEEFFGGGPRGRGWADGLEERTGGWWPRFDPDVLVRSMVEMSEHAFWAEWQRIRCPTFLVLAQSGFLPAEEVEQMLRRRPETVAVSMPGTGHDLHLEKPDALHAALGEFLGLGSVSFQA